MYTCKSCWVWKIWSGFSGKSDQWRMHQTWDLKKLAAVFVTDGTPERVPEEWVPPSILRHAFSGCRALLLMCHYVQFTSQNLVSRAVWWYPRKPFSYSLSCQFPDFIHLLWPHGSKKHSSFNFENLDIHLTFSSALHSSSSLSRTAFLFSHICVCHCFGNNQPQASLRGS